MNETYFLGANTKNGFYSLYDGFPPASDSFLHIIKGGPGSGKSGFMRRIGQEAEKRGLDVQYVICSGDPDSLDGVYIPALGRAWADGTYPHALEPRRFGVDSNYVNLGRFCRQPLSGEDKNYVNQFTLAYKAMYQRAYGYISSAASLGAAALPEVFGETEKASVVKRVDSILDRTLGRAELDCGKSSSRFLSSASCLGRFRLSDEVSKLCKLIYQFDDGFGGASFALFHAAQGAEKRGAELIRCPSPIDPEKLEAILVPSAGLAFVGGGWELENVKHIRIDALIPTEKQQALRPELREAARLKKRIMGMAYEKLAQAKELHDKLEAVYKPHMDFEALTNYTDKEIEKLFG